MFLAFRLSTMWVGTGRASLLPPCLSLILQVAISFTSTSEVRSGARVRGCEGEVCGGAWSRGKGHPRLGISIPTR
ncbi:uncharacterized protein B0T15DRAFT_532413 [Chaetomium strumarium]|uniref:Secreted protein n=1 Tax=Chaetomium strumarium TaxID=1170767 RepID=A0AAJ0GSV9_9PEZI|nr:hypothetical protein B0T15DRAFT_532413 [Chaetomium strumarium]